MNKALLYVIAALSLTGCSFFSYYSSFYKEETLSPLDFGLLRAKTGIERYWILYETHKAAVAAGKSVSYKGIKSISIEIPSDAKSIPLSSTNDFSGVTLNVLNNNRDIYLFTMQPASRAISISKANVDKGDFRSYPELRAGKKLLVIEDSNPWVENREGYSYGHIRKDVLLLNNGKALNRTIMPYDNAVSAPKCSYYEASSVSISNISLSREKDCAYKTFLFYVKGLDGVSIDNISIYTPENNMTSDAVMRIYDCTNVSINDVRVNGTYSRTDYSGYAFSMNNIWHLRVNNLHAKANWSIFGTNNVQDVEIKNSDTNNFDIHCYGRDVEFNHVNFTGRYVQLASVFGDVQFRNCTFTDARVITNGSTYNAYVGYDLVLKDCIFNVSKSKYIILDCGRLDNSENQRNELSKRCLPNITITNLTVNVLENVGGVYLLFFRTSEEFTRTIDYISVLSIDGVYFNYPVDIKTPVDFYISNTSLPLAKRLESSIRNVDVIGSTKDTSGKRGKVIGNLKYKGKSVELKSRLIKAVSVD